MEAIDLKDSVGNKMERLEMQIKKWERQINHFAQKGIICNLSPINKKVRKSEKSIKLRKGGGDFVKQPPTTENAHIGEEAGNPPIKIRLKSGPRVYKKYSHYGTNYKTGGD